MGGNGKKWLNRLLRLDLVISGTAMVALVGVTFSGVFARYAFDSPFVWLEEMQMMLILWAVFVGAAVAVRDRGHVAIEFIVDALPQSLQRIINVLILLIITYVMYFLADNSYEFIKLYARSSRVTNLLHIPLKYIFLACPLGCFLVVVNYFILTIESLFDVEIFEKSEA